MDLSAIIVVVLLGGSFFGFIVWMAIHSRRSNSENSSKNNGEIKFSEVRKRNEQFLEK